MLRWLYNRVVLAEVGPLVLTNYGLSLALGVVAFLWLHLALQAHLGMGLSTSYAALCTLSYSVGFALGAKLLRILYNLRQLRADPRELLRRNGNSFYGGVGGLVAASYLLAGVAPAQLLLDVTFLCLPVFQAFIRTGCATYGCCFGHPTSGPAAIVYRDPDAPAYQRHGDTPLHPSQAYSIVKNLVVVTISLPLFLRFPVPGLPLALWLLLYPALRFFVDFTRDPAKKPYYAGLRSSQWISLSLVALGAWLLLHLPPAQYLPAAALGPALLTSGAHLPIYLLAFVLSFAAFGLSFSLAHRRRALAPPRSSASVS